jgi:DNA-binding transcriptional ArsR family regulator
MDEKDNGAPRQHFVMFPAHLVLALKDNPQSQAILLYVLWRRGVQTCKGDGKWHFFVSEIARTLGKQEKTIRKHLKPLLEMGLLHLTGSPGNQYYLFSEERYRELLTVEPKNLIGTPTPKERHPSQDLGAPPLPKNGTTPLPRIGTLKKIEESREKQITVLSSPVPQDGTAQKLGLEPKSKKGTAGGSVNEVPLNSEGSTGAVPSSSHPASTAPNGASQDRTGQDKTTEVSEKSSGSLQAAASSGGIVPSVPRMDCGSLGAQSHDQGSDNRPKAVPSRPAFVLSPEGVALPLPKHIGSEVSAKRQGAIVKALNDDGFEFVREGAITFKVKGYHIAAYDSEQMVILLTCSQRYAATDHVQRLCAEFTAIGWKIMIWTEEDQRLYWMLPRERLKRPTCEQGQKAA